MIGYLWVSLIIDHSECLICYFLCTELTLFYIELPENCIFLNQSELSNFFMYVNTWKNALVFGQSDARDFLMYIYTYQIQNEMIHSRESLEL